MNLVAKKNKKSSKKNIRNSKIIYFVAKKIIVVSNIKTKKNFYS